MTSVLSIGVIVAIACGGAVLLFGSLLGLVIIFLRRGHRRLSPQSINAASQVDVSDSETSREVYNKASAGRLSCNPYSSREGWTIVSSQDSLPRQQPFACPPKAPRSNIQRQAWPLPRRLTRSTTAPIPAVQGSPSTITKAYPARLRTSTVSRVPKNSRSCQTSNSPKFEQPSVIPLPRTPTADGSSSEESDKKDVSFCPMLKPNLFSPSPARRLSVKSSTANQNISKSRSEAILGQSKRPTENLLATQSSTQLLPRSASWSIRQSGLAPEEPVPPLPLGVINIGKCGQVIASASRSPVRGSAASIESVSSSILNDKDAKSTTSIEHMSTFCKLLEKHETGGTLYPEINKGETEPYLSRLDCSPGPHTSSISAAICPQSVSHKSLGASIEEYCLSGSASDAFSPFFLDNHRNQNSNRRMSCTSNVISIMQNRLGPSAGRSLGMSPCSRRSPRSRFVSRSNSLVPSSQLIEVRSKCKSASILQDISGNQKYLHENSSKRPSSWDTTMSRKGHRRQNSISISIATPSPLGSSLTHEETDSASQLRNSRRRCSGAKMDDISGATFSARPPSVAQFNPKLRALPFPRQPVSVKLRSECEIDGKSSRSSSTSTHSRDPPRQFPSAPPNGGGNIYSLSENTSWSAFPSEDLHSDNSLDYTVSSNESVASLSLSTSRKAPSKAPRPPSILFPYAGFPAPPARSNAPDWRPSGSGPRGPRDAPERPRSPQRRSPTRRSPLRYESRRASRNSASCLQSSVTELRRMNSDVSALSTREREQFVNIGQASPLLEPTAEGTDTVGKDWSLIGCGKAALVNPGLTVKVGKDTFDLVQQPTGVMGRRERGTACHKMPAVQGLRLD